MNFIDRTSLGTTLALKVQEFYGKDAVLLCLQEASILTCITIASRLRAWVYPLIYAPVYASDNTRRLLGAFEPGGEFCAIPEGPNGEVVESFETEARISKKKAAAMKLIEKQVADYGATLDKRRLDGRDVILTADIITSPLPLLVAQHFLKSVHPKSLTALVGNVTPEAAPWVRASASRTEVLDVLSGIVFDDGHYFERNDDDIYTPEQKHKITQQIAAYWQ